MFKFGRSKKKSDLRGVQLYTKGVDRPPFIHRRIFFALSETYYILGGVYPRFIAIMVMITLSVGLNSGTGTPLSVSINVQKYTMERNDLSTVTPEAVAQQKTLVDNLYASLMRRIHSDDFEVYRQRWAKARALLSEMQGALHFARKEVCTHG